MILGIFLKTLDLGVILYVYTRVSALIKRRFPACLVVANPWQW